MQHSDDFPHWAGGRGRFDRMNRIDRIPTRCPRSGTHPVDPVHPVKSSDPGGRPRSRTSGVLHASVVNFRPLPTLGMHTHEWVVHPHVWSATLLGVKVDAKPIA